MENNIVGNENRAPARPTDEFRPTLSFYHANAKGTGSAMKLALYPARGNVDGYIMLTMARQRMIGSDQGPHATFAWEGRVTVKLGFQDLSKMVQVFRGECKDLEGGRGLYHATAHFLTHIVLRNVSEPFPCCSLEIYRSEKRGNNADSHVRIVFSPSETLGLCLALENSFGLLCFGAPPVGESAAPVRRGPDGGIRHAAA